MSVEEIKFNKAIERGELVQFLGGYPEYHIQPLAADLPTEYSYAFTPIKSRLKDDLELREKFVNAIMVLANDPVYGWGAIDYIVSLALYRKHGGIDLLSPELISSVADSLRKNKAAFIALKRWEGINHENGVWSMVRVNNRILNLKHGITVLPEEL